MDRSETNSRGMIFLTRLRGYFNVLAKGIECIQIENVLHVNDLSFICHSSQVVDDNVALLHKDAACVLSREYDHRQQTEPNISPVVTPTVFTTGVISSYSHFGRL